MTINPLIQLEGQTARAHYRSRHRNLANYEACPARSKVNRCQLGVRLVGGKVDILTRSIDI